MSNTVNNERIQILLTNDDGIRSPGLWSAAGALSELGFVTVVAPREQCSGSGRSMPISSDGIIQERQVKVLGKTWDAYAVGGSPAQAVQHGILELMSRKPDLVVAGINYGANVGFGVTVSGTVGAALEGAAMGVPALAISVETETRYHLSYSNEVDFSTAAHFAKFFARMLLESPSFEDLHVLKVEVPEDATPETPWRMSHLSRVPYYIPVKPDRARLDEPARVGYRVIADLDVLEPGSDSHTLRVEGLVAVSPLSLDLTSRLDLPSLEQELRVRSQ